MSATYEKVLRQLVKRAYTPGAEMAQGGMPMDPAMAQQGGMPMDPAMVQQGGMPMDPAMMGGGGMPMDPAMAQQGGMPMGQGGPEQAGADMMGMPITELTIGDFASLIAEIVSEVTGGGAGMDGAPAPEPQKDTPASGSAPGQAEVVDRLDQILQLLGGGASAPMPEGPMGGMGAPKMASTKSATKSVADLIIERMRK